MGRIKKDMTMKTGGVSIKQNPKLKQREISGGRIALYLEFYYGRTQSPRLDKDGNPMFYPEGTKMAGKPMYVVSHHRKKEELKLYLIAKPRTPEERNLNKETLLIAERIRQEREQERLNNVMGYRVNTHKDDNLLIYFDSYIKEYEQKDIRNVVLAVNRFKTFLREYRPDCAVKKSPMEISAIDKEWEERHKDIRGLHKINENEYYRFFLKPVQLTKELVQSFADYLSDNSKGEGSTTAFARFKKIIKHLTKKGVFKVNPCTDVKCSEGAETKEKQALTAEEMTMLINTHYPGESPAIRRAFILSLYTGIRFCDVKDLTYDKVDYSTSTLKFEQNKTKKKSKYSRVIMPLRPDLLAIIGRPEDYNKTGSDLIFDLPSHTMCLKALRRWSARAGITKTVTWHTARRSFATQVLTNGANIAVVASLLGHSGLKYVEVYAKALDERKKAAVDSLPTIG